jgi:hypothetical protein
VISKVFGAKSETSNEIIPWARHEDMGISKNRIKS